MASKNTRGGNSTKSSRRHPGVSLIQRPTGWVARWRDPETGRNMSQSMRGLALTASERVAWAERKANELASIKLAIKDGTYQQKKLERIEAERAAEEAIEGLLDAGIPIAEAVADYLAGIDNPRSRKAREKCMRHFKEWCKHSEIVGTKQLTDVTLRRFTVGLKNAARDEDDDDRDAGLARSTTNTWITYVRTFVAKLPKAAVDREKLDRSDAELRKHTFPKFQRGDELAKVMQPKQAQAMLEAHHAYDCAPSWQAKAKGDYAPFVLAMLLGGFRPGELRSLTWGQVHDSFAQVTAQKSKTNRARRVTFEESPTLRRLLAALRDAAGDPKASALVFPKKEGWRDAKENRLGRDFGLDPDFTLKHCRSTADTVLLYTPGIKATAAQIERRHGHSREVIREHYEGELRPVSKDATSIEAALGIEEIADEIIARVRKGALGEVAA